MFDVYVALSSVIALVVVVWAIRVGGARSTSWTGLGTWSLLLFSYAIARLPRIDPVDEASFVAAIVAMGSLSGIVGLQIHGLIRRRRSSRPPE